MDGYIEEFTNLLQSVPIDELNPMDQLTVMMAFVKLMILWYANENIVCKEDIINGSSCIKNIYCRVRILRILCRGRKAGVYPVYRVIPDQAAGKRIEGYLI